MPENFDQGFIAKKEKGTGEYQQLYLEGIELLQELSNTVWTDFNEHDPGITILENLSYTLTDLSHKTSLPIVDILTESKGAPLQSGDNGLFIASDILTTNPISIDDFRKLFIDRITNVKNVWLHPQGDVHQSVDNNEYKKNLKGLYEVFVETYRYSSDPVEQQNEEIRIKKEIYELFHSHRNLCEDLYDVKIYKPLLLNLEMSLSIDKDANGEEVFANIFFQLNDHLSPEVRFKSLWEMQDNGVDVNDIFDGPKLENGFIEENKLNDRLTYIVKSELLKIVAKIPHIVSVDQFKIGYKDIGANMTTFDPIMESHFPIPMHSSPMLYFPESNNKITFKNGGVKFHPDLGKVQKKLAYIQAMNYGNFKSISQSFNKIEIPKGTSQNVTSYYPVREQLPLIYGIGKFGLQKRLPKKRYAQAKQLKAFLLPFDQIMTNFLAQLSSIYQLYDVDTNEIDSYFYQELEDMPELVDLIKNTEFETKEVAFKKWRSSFDEINKRYDNNAIERLNQAADNILARYAEQFPTYALRKINENCFGLNQTEEWFDKNLLRWKRRLAVNYGHLSYNRAKAYDYKQVVKVLDDLEVEDTHGKLIPGIIEKTAILLGINDYSIRCLSKVMADSGVKIYQKKKGWEELSEKLEIAFTDEEVSMVSVDDIVIIDETVENLHDAFYYVGNADSIIKDVLRNGALKENYEIRQTNSRKKKNKFYVLLTKDNNTTSVVHVVGSKEEANKAIDFAVNYLVNLSDRCEGMYLIEHILLAPPYHAEKFGYAFSIPFIEKKTLQFEQTTLKSNGNRNKDIQFIMDNLINFKKDQFKVVSVHDKFVIQIFTEESVQLAVTTKKYDDEQCALDDLEIVVEQIGSIDKVELNKSIIYHAHYGENKKVDETFFSYQMSFILPSWPVRFQDPNFKSKFNAIVYEQAPVHVAFETFWFNISEMTSFENIYYKWISLVTNNDLEKEQANHAYEIISKIEQNRSQQNKKRTN